MSDTGIGHNGGPVYDYGDDAKIEITPKTLEHLTGLAHRQEECEREVVRCEARLKDAQKALKEVSEYEIPKALDELGLQDFTTSDGLFIEVAESLRVSLPGRENENRAKAMDYLDTLGLGSIIKNTVSVQFGKGEEDAAKELVSELEEDERGLNVTQDMNVHAATLKKNLKDLMEQGKEVDLSLFNGYISRASKIGKK